MLCVIEREPVIVELNCGSPFREFVCLIYSLLNSEPSVPVSKSSFP
jgi:hypothetical protein